MSAPLIRTDFSDDQAWEELLRRAARPYPPDDFQATLQPLSDARLAGLEVSDLAGLGDRLFTVYVADAAAMTGDEWTVLVVDPRRSPVPSFRVTLPALASVENNLSLANLDFDDFARSVDADGVFRGFTPSASRPVRRAFARPLPEQPMTAPLQRSVAPDGAVARRQLERMRNDAIAQHQPHYDLLRTAYPVAPEHEERAAVLTVLLDTLPPQEVVALFRLLYDEPGSAVQRQIELLADGATVDAVVVLAVKAHLQSVGWPPN